MPPPDLGFSPENLSGICRKCGNFLPCPNCISGESGKVGEPTNKQHDTIPDLTLELGADLVEEPEEILDLTHEAIEVKEGYRDRMEQGGGKTKLVEFGWATTSSEKHPERNEDSVGIYEDQNMYAVFDGLGGAAAGNVASEKSRDELGQKVAEARTMIYAHDKLQLVKKWEEVMIDNALVRDEGSDNISDLQAIRAREINEARTYHETLNLPQEVKNEAIAISDALKELSGDVKNSGEAQAELKGMGSTVSGVKIVETDDGRRFGIFFSVGDSAAKIERASNGTIVEAVVAETILEHLIAREMVTQVNAELAVQKVKARDAGDKNVVVTTQDQALYDARFYQVAQYLGHAKPIKPRIKIWELRDNDRITLTTDLIDDNDLKGKSETRLRDRTDEPLEEIAAGTIDDAVGEIDSKTGKGWDDGAVVAIEVKAKTQTKQSAETVRGRIAA